MGHLNQEFFGLGLSSSQMTFICFRGVWLKPPSRILSQNGGTRTHQIGVSQFPSLDCSVTPMPCSDVWRANKTMWKWCAVYWKRRRQGGQDGYPPSNQTWWFIGGLWMFIDVYNVWSHGTTGLPSSVIKHGGLEDGPFMDDFIIETSIEFGDFPAMFDYRRVYNAIHSLW